MQNISDDLTGSAPFLMRNDEREWLPTHQGENYLNVLARLHKVLKPKSYFEIGSRTGDSLALADCGSIAIDPVFRLNPDFHGAKPVCCLYAMGSDEYFAAHDPVPVLGRKIDFAFLDGMHLAEFLLRDFINTEKHCRPNSIIALHDCLPLDAVMPRRAEAEAVAMQRPDRPGWWTGDVWLAVEALMAYRPDLSIHAVDAEPTGLVLITHLNPGSTTLDEVMPRIAEDFQTKPVTKQRYLAYIQALNLHPTSDFTTFEDISRYFWL
jgi:hypothetical protein